MLREIFWVYSILSIIRMLIEKKKSPFVSPEIVVVLWIFCLYCVKCWEIHRSWGRCVLYMNTNILTHRGFIYVTICLIFIISVTVDTHAMCQRSFCGCAQPIRDDVTLQRRLSLFERIHKMIPGVHVVVSWFIVITHKCIRRHTCMCLVITVVLLADGLSWDGVVYGPN